MLVVLTGLRLESIMNSARAAQAADPAKRHDTMATVAEHVTEGIEAQRERRLGFSVRVQHCMANVCCCLVGRTFGNYLVTLYLLIKLIYIANLILQLAIINLFLGMAPFAEFTYFGVRMIAHLLDGDHWYHTGRFPRITFCDIDVRVLANKQPKTVQCVGPLQTPLQPAHFTIHQFQIILSVYLSRPLCARSLDSHAFWFHIKIPRTTKNQKY